MQRVPEVLPLSVIVEWARPPSFEPQPSEEFHLVSGYMTAERSILKEFSEPRFVLGRQPGFSFNGLSSRFVWTESGSSPRLSRGGPGPPFLCLQKGSYGNSVVGTGFPACQSASSYSARSRAIRASSA